MFTVTIIFCAICKGSVTCSLKMLRFILVAKADTTRFVFIIKLGVTLQCDDRVDNLLQGMISITL